MIVYFLNFQRELMRNKTIMMFSWEHKIQIKWNYWKKVKFVEGEKYKVFLNMSL